MDLAQGTYSKVHVLVGVCLIPSEGNLRGYTGGPATCGGNPAAWPRSRRRRKRHPPRPTTTLSAKSLSPSKTFQGLSFWLLP